MYCIVLFHQIRMREIWNEREKGQIDPFQMGILLVSNNNAAIIIIAIHIYTL